MCCKRYHIIFSTSSLTFECKTCVQREVIHNFKKHILVTWPFTNLFSLRKWCGFENQMTIILLKIWPTNRFWKAKSCNFHFHKNDVTCLLVQMAYSGPESCFVFVAFTFKIKVLIILKIIEWNYLLTKQNWQVYGPGSVLLFNRFGFHCLRARKVFGPFGKPAPGAILSQSGISLNVGLLILPVRGPYVGSCFV